MGRASGPFFFGQYESKMPKASIPRVRAASIHLAISATVAACTFAIIYFVWYPGALFAAAGGLQLFLLIACVDVAIGPLMTLIIFVPGKRGLRLDLAIIGILQFAALCYGTFVLYESRPAWLLFVVDRFELVRANDIPDEDRRKGSPPFDSLPIAGPRLAGALKPTNPSEQLRLAISAAHGGRDVQTYPQYYVPYDRVRRDVAARAVPLARLRELNPARRGEIDGLPRKLGRAEGELGFVPLRAGKLDLTALVDRRNGDFLASSNLRPWEY